MAWASVMESATTSLLSVLKPQKPCSGTMPLSWLDTTLPPWMVRPAGMLPTWLPAVPSSLKAPALMAAEAPSSSMATFKRLPGLLVEKPS